jgi:hypothetical protein
MNGQYRVKRVDRGIQKIAAEPAAEAINTDGDQLAREVVRALADELARYQNPKTRTAEQVDPTERAPDWLLENCRTKSPEDVTFEDIERLAKIDNSEAQARWEAVKAQARDDLERGFLAARALEFMGGSAWERACFLAIRQALQRAWGPRNECEIMLLDEMAQYEMVRRKWLGVVSMRSHEPQTLIRQVRQGGDKSEDKRSLDAAEQTTEAARMVERMQRLYQSTLRTLVSLRRGKAPTIFQRSGQVNVTVGPQLNVSVPTEGEVTGDVDTFTPRQQCDAREPIEQALPASN